MTIQSNRFRFLLQIIFSIITTYWFIDLINGEDYIYIWSDYDYTLENVQNFISSGMAFKCIIGLTASYLFFYVIIKYVTKLLVKIFFDKKITDFINTLTNEEKNISDRFFLKINYRWFKTQNKPTKNDYLEVYKNIYKIFSYVLHFVMCWYIIGINNEFYMILIFGIIITIIIIYIFLLPYARILIRD